MNTKLCLVFVLAVGSATAFPFPDWTKYFTPSSFPWKVGTCKFNTYQENFQPELYFTGKWHELKTFGSFLLQADSTCGTMESKINGEEVSILSYQYEPMAGKYVNLRGVANLTEVTKSNYNIKYDFILGLTSVTIPFSVLGTDYKNYAVVYSCQEAFGLISEMGWIMTRQPGDHSFEEEIKNVVDLGRLNYSDFQEQEAVKCPPNPPEF